MAIPRFRCAETGDFSLFCLLSGAAVVFGPAVVRTVPAASLLLCPTLCLLGRLGLEAAGIG